MTVPRPTVIAPIFVLLFVAAGNARAQLNIIIQPQAGLSGNADALAAFQRAGQAWSSRISNPITLTISADLNNSFGDPTVIGSANTPVFGLPYDTVRNAMAARSGEAGLSILSSLPTRAEFSANHSTGTVTNPTNIFFSQANGKALGLNFTPQSFDSVITFNSAFSFDYNRANGVGSGLVDFETVAIHEIGHALGFQSSVDFNETSPATWDLFRFNQTSNNPTNTNEFRTFPREMRQGQEAVQNDLTSQFRLSTGVTGDGNEASHWKGDEFLGNQTIGVMDPTLASGVFFNPSTADYRALELMGYTLVPIPEPATVLGVAALGLLAARRARKAFPPDLAA